MSEGTIVVADDHPVVVEMVAALLERRGYVVIRARDGEEALAAVAAHGPTVLVLDLEMPRLDGWGVLQRLREADEGSRPQIVMLSAEGDEGVRMRALQAGAAEYFVKPIQPQDFAERVAALAGAGG